MYYLERCWEELWTFLFLYNTRLVSKIVNNAFTICKVKVLNLRFVKTPVQTRYISFPIAIELILVFDLKIEDFYFRIFHRVFKWPLQLVD